MEQVTNLASKVTEDTKYYGSEVDEPNLSENPSYSCQFSENPAFAVDVISVNFFISIIPPHNEN